MAFPIEELASWIQLVGAGWFVVLLVKFFNAPWKEGEAEHIHELAEEARFKKTREFISRQFGSLVSMVGGPGAKHAFDGYLGASSPQGCKDELERNLKDLEELCDKSEKLNADLSSMNWNFEVNFPLAPGQTLDEFKMKLLGEVQQQKLNVSWEDHMGVKEIDELWSLLNTETSRLSRYADAQTDASKKSEISAIVKRLVPLLADVPSKDALKNFIGEVNNITLNTAQNAIDAASRTATPTTKVDAGLKAKAMFESLVRANIGKIKLLKKAVEPVLNKLRTLSFPAAP